MPGSDEEYQYWLAFKKDVDERIGELEVELMLASPHSLLNNEHEFLIKKVRMFRETLNKIELKLDNLK
ncbi:MAG: hypothetical protein LH609_11020 [Rudanella sp.]|nr:hypothetical protein [Rudanella sp.]